MRISDWSSDVCSSDLNSEYLIYSLVAVVIIYIFDGIQNLIYGQHPSVHPCRRHSRSAHPSGRRRRTPARTHHRGTAVGRHSTERARIVRAPWRLSHTFARGIPPAGLRGSGRNSTQSRRKRSEEPRVGKELESTWRSRGAPCH